MTQHQTTLAEQVQCTCAHSAALSTVTLIQCLSSLFLYLSALLHVLHGSPISMYQGAILLFSLCDLHVDAVLFRSFKYTAVFSHIQV